MISEYKTSCLIGYTGLVGQTLLEYNDFNYLVNSSNLKEIKDKNIDLIICAAPSAIKWKINIDDSDDLKNINDIVTILSTINTKKIILISTIDVFGEKVSFGGNEDCFPDIKNNHNYGKNRILIENKLKEIFDDKLSIFRLSGLFGKFLKKNLLFDVKNNKTDMLGKINFDSSFQWYNLNYLYNDILNNLDKKLIHLVNEPIYNYELFEKLKLNISSNSNVGKINYNITSKYADNYFYNKESIFEDIKNYLIT